MSDKMDALPNAPQNAQKVAVDVQTGKTYQVVTETRFDEIIAVLSGLYTLLMLGFFLWLLYDVWIGQYSLANLLGYSDTQLLDSVIFHLLAYSFIGGALGGLVNEIRSFLVWHSEREAFGHRFIWKYLMAPWIGAILALFTFALIRSGVAIFSGDSAPNANSLSQSLSTFSIGALAGYGSRKVFVWLDFQVNRIFKVQTDTVSIPDLIGKTQQEAEDALDEAGLKLGDVIETDVQDPSKAGLVISQAPLAGSTIANGSSVNITIGKAATG
jgi:hypothetical protein